MLRHLQRRLFSDKSVLFTKLELDLLFKPEIKLKVDKAFDQKQDIKD